MENMVMASVSSTPVATAQTSTTSTGGKAGGLFSLLLAMEQLNAGGTQANGKKSITANTSDPMMALLMSALMQGTSPINTATAPVQSTTAQQTDTDAVQGAAATDSQSSTVLSLMNLLSSAQGQGGQNAQDTLLNLITANPQGSQQLLALLSWATTGASGTTDVSQSATGQAGSGFAALLAALAGNSGAAASSPATQVGSSPSGIPATTDAAQGNTQVLDEIRQLFNKLIASEPDMTQATGGTATAAEILPALKSLAAAIQPQENALVQDGPSADTAGKPLDLAALLSAISQGSSGQTAEQDATDGKQNAKSDDIVSAFSAGQTTQAESKKEPADFSAALRAYHSQTAGVSAGTLPETKATAAAKPAAEVFDNIVDKITSMQNSNQKEMEISLKPDFLGKVVIKLSMDGDGGLVARITASNPKVQDAFLSQANALQNSLSEQGLKDVRVIVTSASVQDAALQQQSQQRGQNQRDQHKHNTVIVDAADQQSATQPILAYDQAYRTGTINYLA